MMRTRGRVPRPSPSGRRSCLSATSLCLSASPAGEPLVPGWAPAVWRSAGAAGTALLPLSVAHPSGSTRVPWRPRPGCRTPRRPRGSSGPSRCARSRAPSRRTRTARASSGLRSRGDQAVAVLADGRDVAGRAPRIAELRAERADVTVDDVARRRLRAPPDGVADRLPAHRVAGVRREDEQDRLLGAGEIRTRLAALHVVPHHVDLEVADLDRRDI